MTVEGLELKGITRRELSIFCEISQLLYMFWLQDMKSGFEGFSDFFLVHYSMDFGTFIGLPCNCLRHFAPSFKIKQL